MQKYLLFFFLLLYACSNAQTADNKIYNLFLQKQHTKLLEIVENADSLTVNDYYCAGLSAEALEDASLAAFYYKKSIVLDSTFTPAKISLAQSLFLIEEFSDAIEIYAHLLETDTLNAFLWGSLGDCYSKIAFHPLAYSCYENAFYLNPKNSANTLKLVSALINSKPKDYLEEALFYCDSSLIYNPDHKPLLRRKASLLFNNKEFLQAAPVLENLMSLRDSSFVVLKQAGICKALFATYPDAYEAAIFLLRKAHQMAKNDMEVMLHLASSLSHRPAFFDETIEIIHKIRKQIEPDSAIIYQANTILAQGYLGIKDTVHAILQYYFSMNMENRDDRLLRIASLANNVKPENSPTLLWYVHYYFLQNYKPEHERNWNFTRQKSFSQFLLADYISYMHLSGQKKINWQMFDHKFKSVTMDDLRKMIK
jgi:tetratricopeptide (TPR) repeat protein